MASPFTVFRKNQKLMLAVLTLLAMVGFVVLPTVQELMGSRGENPNAAVVTTTRYGSLNQQDLQKLSEDRRLVLRFLQDLPQGMMEPARDAYFRAQEARAEAEKAKEHAAGVAGGAAEAEALQKKADDLQKKADDLQSQVYSQYARVSSQFQQLGNLLGEPSEESVVDTWLLANRARELGLTVGDEAINDFINRQLLEDPVTREPVIGAEQVQRVLDNLKISENQLFHALGRELLALRLRQLFATSLSPTTPGQRWDYYKRLNRKATIELVTLPVGKFTADVPAPDDATLRDFFQKHANQPYNPASPDPGFQVPKKVDLQYFKGEYSKVVDPASVPAQEVKDFYEQHKDQYKRTKLPEAEPAKPAGPQLDAGAGSLPGVNAPEPAKPAETSPKAEKPAAPAEQAAPAKPEQPPKTGTKPEAEKKQPAAKKETPKTEKKEKQKPDAAPKSGKSGDTSSAAPKSPFRLVALEDEKPADNKKADDKKDEKKGQPPAAKAGKSDESQKAEATPKPTATPSEPAAKPAEAAKPGEETKPAETAKPAEAAGGAASGQTAAAAQTEYIPLQEVEKEIRDSLARARTEEMLNKLRDQIAEYGRALNVYEFSREGSEKDQAAPPKPLDFPALAKEHNLTFHETGPISTWDADRLDIAQSNVTDSQNMGAVPYIFDQAAEWRPDISQDTEGNYYLFWVRKKTDQREPKFDEPGVREQVLEAWKMVQARELAVKKADQLAAEARQKGKSLKDVFAGRSDVQVADSEPFSWLTSSPTSYPWMQVPPSLSEIKQKLPAGAAAGQTVPDAVLMPGDDFMRAVFTLDQGGTGVAMNQPKTIAYVVRVIEFNPKDSVLQGPFFKDDYSSYRLAGSEDHARLFREWMERIKETAGLKWERPPIRDVRR